METITNLISSTGFPIVCVIFLWKFVSSTMQEFTSTMRENTMLLKKVYEKLDKMDGDK